MNKSYSQMNELDKIIYSHQNDIYDMEELSDFRHEKWKAEAIAAGRIYPKHYDEKHKTITLRYLVVENNKKKQWAIYDSETEKIRLITFGYPTLNLLNGFLTCSPNYPYQEISKQSYLNAGVSKEDYDIWATTNKRCADEFTKLSYTLSMFATYKARHTQEETAVYAYEIWRLYRYCYQTKLWQHFINLHNASEKDFTDTDENDITEEIEECHEAADEMESDIHKLIQQNVFIHHDFITFAADNDSIISGESYVTDSIENIFSRDLLHILQCDTPMIRECAHCKQLYFSNNNKSRYCDTCKQYQNDIRQQKRKNNPCRYLHKQITDILNNNYDGSEEFRKESNYYWSVVQGKASSKTSNIYDKHITTEKAYLKWLQEKHNQYLKKPKNLPAD